MFILLDGGGQIGIAGIRAVANAEVFVVIEDLFEVVIVFDVVDGGVSIRMICVLANVDVNRVVFGDSNDSVVSGVSVVFVPKRDGIEGVDLDEGLVHVGVFENVLGSGVLNAVFELLDGILGEKFEFPPLVVVDGDDFFDLISGEERSGSSSGRREHLLLLVIWPWYIWTGISAVDFF